MKTIATSLISIAYRAFLAAVDNVFFLRFALLRSEKRSTSAVVDVSSAVVVAIFSNAFGLDFFLCGDFFSVDVVEFFGFEGLPLRLVAVLRM